MSARGYRSPAIIIGFRTVGGGPRNGRGKYETHRLFYSCIANGSDEYFSESTKEWAAAGPGATGENGEPVRPTPLRVDTSRLSPGDRQALVKLIEASRILNDVFMQQMWDGNLALYARLQKDATPLGKARLHYFWINKGPWSDLDEYKAFLPGVPPRKPLGANFYPET